MRVYKILTSLNYHLYQKCNKEPKFWCDHCDYKVHEKKSLSNHIQAKHFSSDRQSHKCHKCGKSYLDGTYFRKHVNNCGLPSNSSSKDRPKRFTCDHCNYKTSQKSHISRHIQNLHLPRDPSINKCRRCGKSFYDRPNLLEHSKICGQSMIFKYLTKRFSCDHCSFKTNTKSMLSDHIRLKHLPPEAKEHLSFQKHFSCNDCEYKTYKKCILAGHIKAIHLPLDTRLSKCGKCNKHFSFRSNLLRHSKICGKSKEFKHSILRFCCDICGYKTHNKSSISVHIQTKHLPCDPNLNKCKNCGKKFAVRSYLKTHLKLCGKLKFKRFICDHCGHRTHIKHDLRTHIKLKHLPRDTNLFKCEKCKKSFSSKRYLLFHSNMCDGLPRWLKPTYSCEHCKFETKKKHTLQKHLLKHLPRDLNSNRCKKCNFSFSSQSVLQRHSEICGKSVEAKRSLYRFSCMLCNYKCRDRNNLNHHIEVNHLSRDARSKKCDKCAKIFMNRQNLLKHSRLCGQSNDFRRSVMNLSCEYCDYKTDCKPTLSNHIQSKHLPRDPNVNKCSKCDKNFSRSSYLKIHSKICGVALDLRTSPQLKRFSCDHCDYKSTTKTLLSIHVKAKHLPQDPNANKCKRCGKSFSHYSNLWRHSKTCRPPKLRLTYCMKCDESTKYSAITGDSCHRCKGPLRYRCPQCLKIYNKINSLRSHLSAECNKEPKFCCEHCNYKCYQQRVLTKHVQARHLPRDPDSNKCSKCGKSFSSEDYLRSHVKICAHQTRWDSNRKAMYCDYCGYEARHKSNLTSHILSNHLPKDSRLNKCRICKKSYSSEQSLKKHSKSCGKSEETIMALKRFACVLCEYKTQEKGNLTRHVKKWHLS